MASSPEISIVVSAFERPQHLKRCLTSIAIQRDVIDKFEVVVADDGSMDETFSTVQRFSSSAEFPICFTTHKHDGYRLAQTRNDGVIASCAPYLLFIDCDCILPPFHLATHLHHRRKECVIAGDCYRLSKEVSQNITCEDVRSGEFDHWVSARERKRMKGKSFRSRIYNLLRLPMCPRLTGNDIGIFRRDFDSVNGFDEQFVGWGLEDRDLQRRLAMKGIITKSILPWTKTYHLWHPPHQTFARNCVGTINLEYFRNQVPNAKCRFGIAQRCQEDIRINNLTARHAAQHGRRPKLRQAA